MIPRLLGPGLNKAGKFPTLVTHNEPLQVKVGLFFRQNPAIMMSAHPPRPCFMRVAFLSKVDEMKSSIKFQLKKVLCMGVAVGNVAMGEMEIYVNTQVVCARIFPLEPLLSLTLVTTLR